MLPSKTLMSLAASEAAPNSAGLGPREAGFRLTLPGPFCLLLGRPSPALHCPLEGVGGDGHLLGEASLHLGLKEDLGRTPEATKGSPETTGLISSGVSQSVAAQITTSYPKFQCSFSEARVLQAHTANSALWSPPAPPGIQTLTQPHSQYLPSSPL